VGAHSYPPCVAEEAVNRAWPSEDFTIAGHKPVFNASKSNGRGPNRADFYDD